MGVFLYIAFVLQTVGLQYTTPSKNAFLTAVNVVIVPFIGLVIYRRKLDLFEVIGAFLAMFGVAVLSLQWSAGINLGDFLSFCCAIGFAFHIFYTAQFVKTEDPIVLTIVQMVTATVIGIIVVLLKGETIVQRAAGRIDVVTLFRCFLDNDCVFIADCFSEIHY